MANDLTALNELIRQIAALDFPSATRAQSDLAAAAWHAGRRPGDKPVLALIGGTGVGKSTLTNRLLDGDLSATSFRRTFTAGPVAITSGELPAGLFGLPHVPADTLPARGEAGRVIVVRSTSPLLARLTLVDSPDVDGERVEHHALAERIFRWADAVAFVVTPEKYQMTELQPYYRLAGRYGVPATFVMNKADSTAVVEDFRGLLARSGMPVATVAVVPRDDSTWAVPDALRLRPETLATPLAPAPAGVRHRVQDAVARANDSVLQPLLELRRSTDRAIERVRALAGDAVDVDVHPLTQQLKRRMQERSVLYLIGPQRILDRARTLPTALVRLPQNLWGWARGGELDLSVPVAAPRGEPPDFKAVVTEQFQALQNRIADVIGQSPGVPQRPAEWTLDPQTAGKIADEEIAALRDWLETRWNSNPRDTALLLKLLKVVPGGNRVTKYFETAPYLLAVACLATSHMMGHIDMLVLGGWAAVTGVLAKLSDEVQARVNRTNARIAERYQSLASQQVEATATWLNGLAPSAATLDRIAVQMDRVRSAF